MNYEKDEVTMWKIQIFIFVEAAVNISSDHHYQSIFPDLLS